MTCYMDRILRLLAGLLCLPAIACTTNCPASVSASKPNVLLILIDDLGYSDLGCYGGEIATPQIDRLAAEGLRFTQCYNSARCCPSRASLITGQYPHQVGIGSFATAQPDRRRGPAYLGHLNDRCVTIAEVLKSAGYQTYMVGKWHMERPGPIKRGFDEFYGFTLGYAQDQWSPDRYQRLPAGRPREREYVPGEFYATDAFSDYASEFLRQAHQKQAPWFLYLAYSSPHFPLQAPAASVEPLVATYCRGWDALRRERFERMKKSGLATDAWTLPPRSLVPVDEPQIANGFSGQQNPAWDSLSEARREDLARRMAIFAAMVQHVDQGVGRITDQLAQYGELQNTLIFILSDNGACYEWGPFGFDGESRTGVTLLHQGDDLKKMGGPGTHHAYGSAWANFCNTPLRLYKHFTHEGGICTPLIVHWPKGMSQHNRWVRDPVHIMDIMPTICEATGATYPAKFDGHEINTEEGTSLMPTFRGVTLTERVLAFEHQEARALRQGRWKVVWSKRMPHEIHWELYDLQTDRCETHNLAQEQPERCQALADLWLDWARRVKVYPFYKPPEQESNRRKNPQIANRVLTITCHVAPQSEDGVILAQGGNQRGYALHLEGGNLVFCVRIEGAIHSITAQHTPHRPFDIRARLMPQGHMSLEIDRQVVAEGEAAGLIPVQPMDELSIGYDSRTAVGEYSPPNRLLGAVERVKIVAETSKD